MCTPPVEMMVAVATGSVTTGWVVVTTGSVAVATGWVVAGEGVRAAEVSVAAWADWGVATRGVLRRGRPPHRQ